MNKGIIVHSLIINNGKLLILKRAKNTHEGGLWDLPGGTLEDGEDLLDGVIREILEETGLKIENLGLFYHKSNIDVKKNKQFITIIFIAKLNHDNLTININANEHSQAKWVAPEDIINYKTVSYLKPCIKYYTNKKHPMINIIKN